MSNTIHPSQIGAGHIIGVPATVFGVPGAVEHKGLISTNIDAGLPLVWNASKRTGMVLEETWAEFTQGSIARIRGFPGNYTPEQVVARARSKRGTVWKLFGGNCEHFTTWAHGLQPHSPQLQAVGKALALAAVTVAVVGVISSDDS